MFTSLLYTYTTVTKSTRYYYNSRPVTHTTIRNRRFDLPSNYYNTIPANRDTLWEQIQDLWHEHILKALADFSETFLLFVDKMSFWVTCLGCIYNIWLYAATRDDKYTKKITVMFLTYIFIQMIIGEFI